MKTGRRFYSAMVIALALTGCATAPTHLVDARNADAAYVSGDFRSALQGYLAWPGGNDDPHVQTKIGNCAALLGQPALAEQAYQRALTLDPNLPEVRYNLAVLYLKQAQSQLIAALPQSGQLPALKPQIQTLLMQIAQTTPFTEPVPAPSTRGKLAP
ncbi:MAG: tetratricopeptide repeat protein [Thiomonas arsenitoxydans]|uniref:Tetratricopeptide repeat protein n=1 Tax=Thiomonas arsenitoxydans (strain DSM 22701 / CIP 110005 / 3As) TaxID=426114 RepID=A0A8I1MZ14_THIA3|nr:tetratricopeptide repeat protein [Thiomonas arsenitoxydans]MBN8745709.1 tetratricopeptide repeat protein [Thiomonas arsenitoxydans]